MSHIAFTLSKLNFVSSCVVYVMFKHACLAKNRLYLLSNINVIHQRCWFVKKTLL
ncbi:hypothetical protein AB205_0143100 [Aquarana catesbeiana]|uniref:Uncharacterized protein n=1 Tax=Aquarana catesbeiana TaxID=8400 RepID=A0A2G9RCM2_AQUCT|nr:hypothetical protein AB205_0143100 [Aquarana catesbeiana]